MADLIFNEGFLLNLLESPDGAYGDRLLLVAQQITGNYNDAIAGVWQNQHAAVQPTADFSIDRGQFGLEATVGILPGGRTSDYMAHKFADLEPDRFVPKIMAGWDNQL